MQIVVTGAAGFIGSHLVEALLMLNHTVIGIDNFHHFYSEDIKIQNILESVHKTASLADVLAKKDKAEKIAELIKVSKSEQYSLYGVDIKDFDSLGSIFADHSIAMVINLAGLAGVRPSLENPLEYEKVNIGGYMHLLECAKKYGVSKFIQASSSSVYGNNKVVPFTETDIVDFAISPYAGTKKACEVMGHIYHSLYHIDTLQLRFFTVYGPRQRPDLAIHKFTKKIMRGEAIPVYGNGDTYRDYTYVDDIIDGIIKGVAYLEKNKNVYEIINLGESEPISLNQMISTIEDVLGKKAVRDTLPMQAGDVEKTYANIDKAKTMLGYKPTTSFSDGIKKFVQWLG